MRTTAATLTPRERLLAAATGHACDRTPVLHWLNPHAACKMMATVAPAPSLARTLLARALWRGFVASTGGRDRELPRLLPYTCFEYANSSYLLSLGSDGAFKSMGNFKSAGRASKNLFREEGQLRFRDPFGGVRALGGVYLDVVQPPVESVEELERFVFPSLDCPEALGRFRLQHPEACLLIEVGGPLQLTSQNIFNLEGYMLALYDRPDLIDAFHARVADWSLGIARRAVSAGADMVFIGDDYGMNDAPLISMELWVRYVYPHLSRMIREIHRMGVPVMLHSCGYQMPFLEYYVEAGLDVLQSFQPMAGNDLESAVAEFGGRLTFATGIDTQQGEWMPPGALREDILDSCETGMSRGRFILAMTHMLQYTMPTENIQTILETVCEIQRRRPAGVTAATT